MSNRTYDILKYIAQIALPAITALWLSLSKIWGLPFGEEIGATLAAIDLCLGALLKISSNNYAAVGFTAESFEELTDNKGDENE